MAAPVIKTLIDETIELDVTLSAQHNGSVEVTKHPVEEGADPTDHARELPDRLSMEALVTNTPLFAPASRSSAPGEAGYSQKVLGQLRALKKSRKLVKVRAGHRTYENMMLTTLNVPEDSKVADAVRMSLTFEEVRFVKSERVRLESVTKTPEAPLKKIDKGKKAPETPPAEQNQTVMKKITDYFGATTAGDGL